MIRHFLAFVCILSAVTLVAGGTRNYTSDASGNVTAEARAGVTYNAADRM